MPKKVLEVQVQYVDANKGLTTREFSAELHGKDFLATAKQFSKKHNGQILTGGEVDEAADATEADDTDSGE